MDFSSHTLQFPLEWHGRLIVDGGDIRLTEAISQILSGAGLHDFTVEQGNCSASGRYVTFNIVCNMPELTVFRAVGAALGQLPGVRTLL